MALHITTPFGRRSLTAAQIQAQANADGCPRDTTVNKWAVFRHLAVAKDALGISDRSLAVLNALLSFHPETTLTRGEGADLIVFPSNAQLALRAHGIAEKTLRRHLAALTEAGLVIRRDSPNGKRYARRGQGGEVVQAFGFDITPLVARATEFAALAEGIQAEHRAHRLAREKVTLLRRDVAKMLAALSEQGTSIDQLAERYRCLMGMLPRAPRLAELEDLSTAFAVLATDVSNALIDSLESQNPTGSDGQDGRHNQNSKPDAPESERASEIGEEGEGRARPAVGSSIRATYPLGMVLEACPDVIDYARGGVRSWGDLIDAASLVRSMLGISPSAWREAQEIMGAEAAAVTIAAILQRAEHIKSPGGYLRTLVERKRGGQYSLGPVLQALNRARISPFSSRAH